jgi:chromosome segregation ATPase
MLAAPPSLPLEPHGLISNNDGNSISMGPDQALIDWRAQMLLLAQQNEEKLAIEKEFQHTLALQAITSLPEKLDVAHESVKDWLGALTFYLRSIGGFSEDHEERIREKEEEIAALEEKYGELMGMTPVAHRDDLRQVKDRVIRAMQRDMEALREKGEEMRKKVEGKNDKRAEVERALERTRELVPVLVGDLIKLEQRLSDV